MGQVLERTRLQKLRNESRRAVRCTMRWKVSGISARRTYKPRVRVRRLPLDFSMKEMNNKKCTIFLVAINHYATN